MPSITIEESTVPEQSSAVPHDSAYLVGFMPPVMDPQSELWLDGEHISEARAPAPMEEQQDCDKLIQNRNECTRNSKRRPSFSAKQLDDVAAAVRFRLGLERSKSMGSPQTSDNWSPDHTADGTLPSSAQINAIDGSSRITRSRLTRVRDSQSVIKIKPSRKPSPLHLGHDARHIPVEIQSADFYPRYPSLDKPLVNKEALPSVPLRRSKTVAVLKAESYRVFTGRKRIKAHSRESNVPPLPSFDPTLFNNLGPAEEPALQAQSLSDQTHCIESQTRETGLAEITISRQPDTISPAPSPLLYPASSEEHLLLADDNTGLNQRRSITPPIGGHETDLKRNRSFFRWLQRRSELDDLIELYMDDSQLDTINHEKKLAKPRWAVIWPMRRFTDPVPGKSTAVTSKL